MSVFTRPFLTAALAVALAVGSVPLFAGNAPAQAAPPVSVKTSSSYPVRGKAFLVSGRLRTHIARPVALQRRSGSKWLTVVSSTASKSGRYSFSVTASLTSYKLRVVAKKVRIGKRTYSRLVSSTRTLRTVAVTPVEPIRGERFTVSDSVAGKKLARPVALQRLSGKKWVTVAKGRTSSRGVFSLTTSTTASSVKYRVVATKTRIKKKTYRRIVTKSFKVATVAQSATLSLPATGVVGGGLAASLSFSPVRPGRAVRVEMLTGGVWRQVGSGAQDASGKASVAVSPTTDGTVSFRGVAAAANGAPEAITSVQTVAVDPGVPGPAAVVGVITGNVVDGSFEGVVSASGGTTPYRWTATGLPGGVSLNPDTGVLSGTPTQSGTFSVTFTVTDAKGKTATVTTAILVRPLVGVGTASLPAAVVGTDYTFVLEATGGTEPFTWAADTLPTWLSLSDGTLTGTPTATGTETFTVTVTDANHKTASKELSITVDATAGLTITTATLPDALIGTGYAAKVLVTGGTAPLTWSATGLPSGFTIDSATGRISGTPTQSGAASVEVTISDADSRSASAPFTLTTTTRPAITSTLADGQVGVAYSAVQNVSGGTSPYLWSATGLPDGLSLDTATGAITGTPTTPSSRGVSVTVTDALGHSARASFPAVFSAKASAVSIGSGHTCTLTEAGAVLCWGNNGNGQLGDGTNTTRSIAGPVSGLTTGLTAVTAGSGHSCALTTAGGVKCWGANSSGQLGDGTTTASKTPVDVVGLASGVVAIEAGNSFTCAVTNAGAVKCWGYNNKGQLGDGTTTNRSAPVAVSSLSSDVVDVVAGYTHTCAITSSGGAKCWGYNNKGQLGDGTTTDSSVPVDVANLTSGVTSIAVGEAHTCAVVSGGVKCWGYNNYGQLGNGGVFDRLAPTDVTGLTTGASAVSAAFGYACALTDAGGAKCWGLNSSGQLGDATIANRTSAVSVTGLSSGVSAISAGHNAACALLSSGAINCWGQDLYGELGDNAGPRVVTPSVVSGLPVGVSKLYAGGSHSCALTSGGALSCWGQNTSGQLGDGTTTQRVSPVAVSGLDSGVAAAALGYSHSCAVTDSGGLKCWGANNYGGLGDGTTTVRKTPQDVSGMTSGVAGVAAGMFQTCAVTTSGAAKCWGRNNYGQLGDGTTTDALSPVDVVGLSTGVVSVVAGSSHACALMDSGAVKCWGVNSAGQLGDGTTVNRPTPVDVLGLPSGVTAISTAGTTTCALTSNGGVKCWGNNAQGQVGDGSLVNAVEAVDVIGLAGGVESLVVGASHGCVLAASGQVACWGQNSVGQLGNGTTVDAGQPTHVPGLSGVTALFSGATQSFAVTSGGEVMAWGNNNSAQLARTTVVMPSPVAVVGMG